MMTAEQLLEKLADISRHGSALTRTPDDWAHFQVVSAIRLIEQFQCDTLDAAALACETTYPHVNVSPVTLLEGCAAAIRELKPKVSR